MRRTETPKPIWIKFCLLVDILDVVTYTNFGDHRLRGCWVSGGQISPSFIDFHRRPYNTLALPCERVIYPFKHAHHVTTTCNWNALQHAPSWHGSNTELPRSSHRAPHSSICPWQTHYWTEGWTKPCFVSNWVAAFCTATKMWMS